MILGIIMTLLFTGLGQFILQLAIQNWMNKYPRKKLKWLSSYETALSLNLPLSFC